MHDETLQLIEKAMKACAGFRAPLTTVLAAAIVHLKYERCFAVLQTEIQCFTTAVLQQPIPKVVERYIGAEYLKPEKGIERFGQRKLLPYFVFLKLSKDFSSEIDSILNQSLLIIANPKFAFGWESIEKPLLLETHNGSPSRKSSDRSLSEKGREAYHELAIIYKVERELADPCENGKPSEIFIVPKPELESSFSWWCLQLGFMLESPHVTRKDYVSVIDELGAKCLLHMPNAHAQTLAEARLKTDSAGRYSTDHNLSLPKYARFLIKRGLFRETINICERALEFGIMPASVGAFERSLAAARRGLEKTVQPK